MHAGDLKNGLGGIFHLRIICAGGRRILNFAVKMQNARKVQAFRGGIPDYLFLHRTGADAEDRIGRADADESGQQRNRADVAPHRERAGCGEAYQSQACNNT